jgi:hypothetical protein
LQQFGDFVLLFVDPSLQLLPLPVHVLQVVGLGEARWDLRMNLQSKNKQFLSKNINFFSCSACRLSYYSLSFIGKLNKSFIVNILQSFLLIKHVYSGQYATIQK